MRLLASEVSLSMVEEKLMAAPEPFPPLVVSMVMLMVIPFFMT